ncbi:hypothetical protein M6B38_259310 [Iris pallida]|uniref:Uncharacterized protein n=1 Tax=Iris pallida TaxID=29817 RepID=A0AAX6EKA3_IRIPA|nr:hypothetical protein M6B38_183320 [Iris pallida]KAJ6851497.1 hypothetical protein M6B38_259310 [Iris pallida]
MTIPGRNSSIYMIGAQDPITFPFAWITKTAAILRTQPQFIPSARLRG